MCEVSVMVLFATTLSWLFLTQVTTSHVPFHLFGIQLGPMSSWQRETIQLFTVQKFHGSSFLCKHSLAYPEVTFASSISPVESGFASFLREAMAVNVGWASLWNCLLEVWTSWKCMEMSGLMSFKFIQLFCLMHPLFSAKIVNDGFTMMV